MHPNIVRIIRYIYIRPKQKVSGFCPPHASPQTHASAFKKQFFWGGETMSNCSQNCWIDWNSAVLCFKWIFHIGVWTFATILCTCQNLVPRIQMYHVFPCWQKKKDGWRKKNASPHWFWSRLMTRNRRLFGALNKLTWESLSLFHSVVYKIQKIVKISMRFWSVTLSLVFIFCVINFVCLIWDIIWLHSQYWQHPRQKGFMVYTTIKLNTNKLGW